MLQSRVKNNIRFGTEYRTRCSCGWFSGWKHTLDEVHRQLTNHVFSNRKVSV